MNQLPFLLQSPLEQLSRVHLVQPGMLHTNPLVKGRISHARSYRPVDSAAREAEISTRLEKEREEIKEKVQHTMSRQNSQQPRTRGQPPASGGTDGGSASPTGTNPPTAPSSPRPTPASITSTVRPTFSFAAAARKEQAASADAAAGEGEKAVEETAEKLAEVSV
jgi:translation initiation factor 4B